MKADCSNHFETVITVLMIWSERIIESEVEQVWTTKKTYISYMKHTVKLFILRKEKAKSKSKWKWAANGSERKRKNEREKKKRRSNQAQNNSAARHGTAHNIRSTERQKERGKERKKDMKNGERQIKKEEEDVINIVYPNERRWNNVVEFCSKLIVLKLTRNSFLLSRKYLVGCARERVNGQTSENTKKREPQQHNTAHLDKSNRSVIPSQKHKYTHIYMYIFKKCLHSANASFKYALEKCGISAEANIHSG